MDVKPSEKLQDSNIPVAVEKLNKPMIFETAVPSPDVTSAKIICNNLFTINKELYIWSGSALILCKMHWHVTEKAVPEPLLRRSVFKDLG